MTATLFGLCVVWNTDEFYHQFPLCLVWMLFCGHAKIGFGRSFYFLRRKTRYGFVDGAGSVPSAAVRGIVRKNTAKRNPFSFVSFKMFFLSQGLGKWVTRSLSDIFLFLFLVLLEIWNWTREAVHFVYFLNIFQLKTLRIRGLDAGGHSFCLFFEHFSVEDTTYSWPGLCAAENFVRSPCTMKYCPVPKSVAGKKKRNFCN